MTNNTSAHENNTSNLHLRTLSCNVQNFVLVWLDANIDEVNNPDSVNTITQLRNVVNVINTFVDVNLCIDFLMNIQNEKVFMIVSGSLGQTIVPRIHGISQVTSIYIFCRDKTKHENWAKKWLKIKGVFTDILPLSTKLKQVVQQCDQDSIPISFISTNNDTSTTKLDQSFMYIQLLKEILFDIDFNKRSIKEFTTYCRAQFADNKEDLNMIDKFERKYHQFTPIWWYTNQCFLYPMLNRSLRNMEVDIIIKMSFFIRDLHRHIEELYQKQYKDLNQEQLFIVYRGQGLSKKSFNEMRKMKGGLISFNSFLSSSKKRNIALIYAHRAITDFDSMGIVFKMTIDPSISSIHFALVNDVSFYKASEQEVLFSMHTVFHIGDIKQIDVNNSRLWEVELTLTSENDPQLNAFTQLMRKEICGVNEWDCLGQLLVKLGKFDKAEDLYKVLLNRTSDDSEKRSIYHQLGWIKDNLGNYVEAISFYEKSLEIDEKTLPLYHPDLAISYDNIGLIYNKMGDYIKALSSHEKALQIYRATLPADHPDLAASLNHIGLVYDKMGEYIKALICHREALEIFKKILPPNHPSLAASYNNIGLVHDKIDDCSKALWFYEKTLEIYQKTLPPSYPDLAICYQNIGKALEKMCEYSKALSSYEKAVDIFQKTFPSNHPHLATCYSYIASVYKNMSEYLKAILFYEKALAISEQLLHSNHPDLIILYNNVGEVYEHMKEYSRALSSYQKGLHICQRNIASNDPLLASLHNRIANVLVDDKSFAR
ncbi:unnamed protein product [Rotaria sp. Silwood2]|nr:unnamed protein product [Rotaria sp. Silwood2]